MWYTKQKTNKMDTLKNTAASLITTFNSNELVSFMDINSVEEFSKNNKNCLGEQVAMLIHNFNTNQLMSFTLLNTIVKELTK